MQIPPQSRGEVNGLFGGRECVGGTCSGLSFVVGPSVGRTAAAFDLRDWAF